MNKRKFSKLFLDSNTAKKSYIVQVFLMKLNKKSAISIISCTSTYHLHGDKPSTTKNLQRNGDMPLA
jgi:hypothetical protein